MQFARAIGAARAGDAASARREVEALTTIQQTLTGVKGDYDWARQVEIHRQVATAWLAYAEGKQEEAIELLRKAADLDDATDKHPVTPGSILPAREQLGELLLEIKKPAAALREFETSFKSTPQRFNGLYGAARAAQRTGDRNAARNYYQKLMQLVRGTDSDRPEINEAKVFLARR